MTFVFVPPWAIVGAKVVWVQACTKRDMPSGSSARTPGSSAGSRSARSSSGG